jgi:hypothetical protein
MPWINRLATAAMAELPASDPFGVFDGVGLYIPPPSRDLGCSGISLCDELTLGTIGTCQGIYPEDYQAVHTTTNTTSSMPLKAPAGDAAGNVDVIQREPHTAAIVGGRSP